MWSLCNVLGIMHMEVQKLQDCIYFRVFTHVWSCRGCVFILAPKSLANMADNVAMWGLFKECNIGLLLDLSERHIYICLKFI